MNRDMNKKNYKKIYDGNDCLHDNTPHIYVGARKYNGHKQPCPWTSLGLADTVNRIILLTESGYLLLCKSLTDDRCQKKV